MNEIVDCWAVLELPSDADERSVKRHYARLLKIHRPEEDPIAFQKLRDAYEQALQQIRWRELNEEYELDYGGSDQEATARIAVDTAQSGTTQVADTVVFDENSFIRREEMLEIAEESIRRAGFEKSLLEYCLLLPEQHIEWIDWAIQRLDWFTPAQQSELPAEQLDTLAIALCHHHLQVVSPMLEQYREKDVLHYLRELQDMPWLQSIDRKNYFQQQLISLLLIHSRWSADFFEQLCKLYNWSDTQHAADNYQWSFLRQNAEAASYEKELKEFLQWSSAVSPECRAAWLLLKPMSDREKRRLATQFGNTDWKAVTVLRDVILYRYPQLQERFDYPELECWNERALAIYSGEGWKYIEIVLFVLLFIASGALLANQNEKPIVLIPVFVFDLFLLGVGRILVSTWHLIVDESPLCILDQILIDRVLPHSLKDIRIFYHLIPALVSIALISFLIAQSYDINFWLIMVPLIVLGTFYIKLAAQGQNPVKRCINWFKRILLWAGTQILVLSIAYGVLFMIKRLIKYLG